MNRQIASRWQWKKSLISSNLGWVILFCLPASLLSAQEKGEPVFVCKHYAAHTYHASMGCKGLNGCQNGIHTSIDSAERVYKRKPCCLCVGGMFEKDSSGCRTDNLPKSADRNSSGGGPDLDGCFSDGCDDIGSGCNDPYAAAIVGSIALAGLIALLSNDIYVGGTYSMYSDPDMPVVDSVNLNSRYVYPGFGIDAHFRKNFEVLRLEYGGSYVEQKAHYYGTWSSNNSPYEFDHSRQYFTAYAGMPFYLNGKYSEKSLLFFFGPAFRWSNEAGVGGVAGFHVRMGEFFKFEVRYELTQITNQFQAGFVLTYQRDYSWW